MQDETLIGALIGVATGGGVRHWLGRLFGPDRARIEAKTAERIARYHNLVTKGLQDENTWLRSQLKDTRDRLASVEQRLAELETQVITGDLPPELA